MLEKNKLFFSISYICNFKPQLLNITNNNSLSIYVKLRLNNHILCRNFFLFLLYLKYCFKKKFFSNLSIFIKPVKTHRETILRAPYRYKLGRYQLGISRYSILCTFNFLNFKVLNFKSTSDIFFFTLLLKKFYPWIESNICFQHKVFYSFWVYYANNFLIKNYKLL